MILRDFSKILTFLAVAREKSFSRASSRLNISQPAVTQQIRQIEDYLKCKIIERKKTGIVLTKEGETLYKIATKLESSVEEGEKELAKLTANELPLTVAACAVAGEYLLPCCMNDLKSHLACDFSVLVEKNSDITAMIKNRQADIALFSPTVFDDEISYTEWLEDEIVLFSNQPLAKVIKSSELEGFSWIGREESSQTRRTAQNALQDSGIDCSRFFDIKSIFGNANAIKQAVLRSPKISPQTVSIISRFVIDDEVDAGKLYSAQIAGCNIKRKIYFAHLKVRNGEKEIEKALAFLQEKKEQILEANPL